MKEKTRLQRAENKVTTVSKCKCSCHLTKPQSTIVTFLGLGTENKGYTWPVRVHQRLLHSWKLSNWTVMTANKTNI